jgi:glycogen phosphorylase
MSTKKKAKKPSSKAKAKLRSKAKRPPAKKAKKPARKSKPLASKKGRKAPSKAIKKSVVSSDVASLQRAFLRNLQYTLVKDQHSATPVDLYLALAYSVREKLAEGWLDTQESYYVNDAKRLYYVSMEFLVGRSLGNAMINLGVMDQWERALEGMGFNVSELLEIESDAALGNGGLGRLAACFLDSMATLNLPAYGYGIRYEYGMFYQQLVNGSQVELPDNWLHQSNPWEFVREEHFHKIQYGGRVEESTNDQGQKRYHWRDTEDVFAIAYDVPIPGYGNRTVNTMRLWGAKSAHEFNLELFNRGNYSGAIESKIRSENISKVLYPADHIPEGRELRLRQEYFLASATVRDIFYRFLKTHSDFDLLPEKVAVQLNDTHPTLAIPEMLRIFLDEIKLPWDRAWKICLGVFAYTNHTVMAEALEKWPVSMLESLLPRHLMIIYEINHYFLDEVSARFPDDLERLRRMSIIGEEGEKHIRMANLAIVGSHSINGVSALHSEIIKNELFHDFYEMWPERFNSKTNGITQRRWLMHANRPLSSLISLKIGSEWITDLDQIRKLQRLAEDSAFQLQWMEVKRANKERLAREIFEATGIEVTSDSMFDCHTKRVHEYKRQLLNILHVISRYNRIKAYPQAEIVPRTIIFSGKAAPSYFTAKLIIQLINSVANVVNNDPDTNELLKVVFLPNYNVSLAERIFPAADLSQQISTAGTEASGTGNMKYALNGAITIGTLDGANIEIMEEVGRENIFIFGLNAEEVKQLKASGYNPREYYERDSTLKRVIDMIADGTFGDAEQFKPIVDMLLNNDPYLLLADFASYVACQEEVDRLYVQPSEWARKSILNSAGMGKFSSDRTIAEYARDIWDITPERIIRHNRHDLNEREFKELTQFGSAVSKKRRRS